MTTPHPDAIDASTAPQAAADLVDTASTEEWQNFAAWALALVHALCESGNNAALRRRQFVNALAERFNAAVRMGITRIERGPLELEVIESGDANAAAGRAPGKAHELTDIVPLAGARVATLTLRRPSDAAPFREVDARCVATLHASCAWIYSSAAAGAGKRVEQLSPREREALQHLLRGASEKEVAAFLGRSRHTVHSYVKRIYRTLGVRSRAELRSVFREAVDK